MASSRELPLGFALTCWLALWVGGCALVRPAPEESAPRTLLDYDAWRGGFSVASDGPVEVHRDTHRVRETLFHRVTYLERRSDAACALGYLEPALGALPQGRTDVQLRRVAESLWGGPGRPVSLVERGSLSGLPAFEVSLPDDDGTVERRLLAAHGRYYFFGGRAGRTCAWEDVQLLPGLFQTVAAAERQALRHTLATGCSDGHAAGCFAMAELNWLGWEGEPDQDRIIAYLQVACDRDHPFGCAVLGGLLTSSADPSERRRGVRLLFDACDRDHGQACLVLALMHQDGYAVERNLGRAGELIERAVDLGAWSPEQPFEEASEVLMLLCDRGQLQFCPEVRRGG